MAKKKAQRTELRSSKGKLLYAVRDAGGKFEDIQTYKRAHTEDMQRVSKAETAKKAKAAGGLPGMALPIPTPGVAAEASPLTRNLTGGKAVAAKSAPKKATKPVKKAAKKAAPKAAAKKPAAKKAAPKKAAKPMKKAAKKKK